MKTYCRFLAVALLTGLLGTGLRAQAPAGALPSKIYTKRTAFKLPFRIDDKERAELQEVKLYVKNGPQDAWTCKETAMPSQADFTYRVAQDGEYWFSVVTVDKTGRTTPADVTREPPGLIVVVDTQPPDFDVRPFTLANGEKTLQCKVRDANPDYTKVKLEYRTDRGSQILEPLAEQPGLYRVSDPSLQGVVRATVTDRAGNTTMREINLAGPSRPVQQVEAMAASLQTQSVQTQVDNKPPVTKAQVATSKMAGAPTLQLINSTHASLDYQIESLGASGVGKVEVWLTRDEGQTWQLLCEDSDRHSPADIELPGEGLFGLSLVVSSGNGNGGTPPARGDNPDWWVEVDTTKPAAQLVAVHPGAGEDANTFVITWTASDKNPKPDPIDLYYATDHQGPWTPIARGLKNSGSYRWPVPHGAGPEFYFRMDVTDRAGNMTHCESSQPVVMDTAVPKGRVLGIVSRSSELTPGSAH